MLTTTLSQPLADRMALAHRLLLLLVSGLLLTGCILSQAADNTQSSAVAESKRPIDWDRANADALASGSSLSNQRSAPELAVPILLPPTSLLLTDTGDEPLELANAQIITDSRGYSSVNRGERFVILIDASDRTFATENNSPLISLADFDGEYQTIDNGGQISIGRYGALYAVQLRCQLDNQADCVTERMVREIIESLIVSTAIPK